MVCPGSVAACAALPRSPSTTFAEEGTAAHALAERCLLLDVDVFDASIGSGEWDAFDSPEFREHVQTYLDYCRGIPGEALTEIRFDLSDWIPRAFGTADRVVVDDTTLHVIDLKFGKGLRVDGVGNVQARCYALGALAALQPLYGTIERVQTHIVQPRIDWNDGEVLTVDELLAWARTELAPAAEAATKPDAPRYPSAKACQWCDAKAICRARADQNLELAKSEFGDLPEPATLSPAEIGQIVLRIDELVRWASDMKDYAMAEAIAGRPPPGTKLVAGRGRRVWKDEQQAAIALAPFVPEDELWVRKLATITAIEKRVGKKDPTLPTLVDKKPGKPALVSTDDPRPEFAPAGLAALDFAD